MQKFFDTKKLGDKSFEKQPSSWRVTRWEPGWSLAKNRLCIKLPINEQGFEYVGPNVMPTTAVLHLSLSLSLSLSHTHTHTHMKIFRPFCGHKKECYISYSQVFLPLFSPGLQQNNSAHLYISYLLFFSIFKIINDCFVDNVYN